MDKSFFLKYYRNPIGSITKSSEATNKLAPIVASFSSRGPNPVNPNILKVKLVHFCKQSY